MLQLLSYCCEIRGLVADWLMNGRTVIHDQKLRTSAIIEGGEMWEDQEVRGENSSETNEFQI